ncbi:uncharacterized protein LOC127748844 isoform X2 [Frankliniella occidentalis]|uniref:Uncharacterized protein LOC127748844 isoform X2 n=1 Tax=Frankliniella occidentalis TaxID=133901 RepID=A0A9C6U1M9_FRAOC|nr:uncharacterized protein LOC127748844 isoform X2 [Frankliniella occidentalis]
MGSPAVFSLPATGLQPPFAFPPFGPAGPLWWTVVLTQLETTTTPKPSSASPPIVAVLPPFAPYPPYPPYAPYPPYPPSGPAPLPPQAPQGLCNVNCPAVWDPVCSVNGVGYMYNFANQCALQAQNCVSGSDFRYLYPGICRLKR